MLITNQASLHIENMTKTFGFAICYPWKVAWISYVEFHGVKELHHKIMGAMYWSQMYGRIWVYEVQP